MAAEPMCQAVAIAYLPASESSSEWGGIVICKAECVIMAIQT